MCVSGTIRTFCFYAAVYHKCSIPDTEARRRRGVLLGIQNLAAKAEDKEQLFDAKGFASAASDSLLDVRGVAGPLARREGL